ncbi:hypothetical protein [Haloferula rosea]|uniref:Organic solvent tolerance-like N-terminal domain-containing protein n=1 Tax=Haloferula rosea TaxID=490093 RepID=A0A934RG88_9BACT|nr:hypothetical protein [Haloferula rosea]MBK1829003.1 hypothetical protein [Haloferula rosea]
MKPRSFSHPRPRLCWLGLGALALTGAAAAQGLPMSDKDEADEDDSGLPAMEMLVEGSILKKIIIPQYDEQQRLSSVLRADQLVMVDKKTIEATKARIEFFQPDQTLRGSIDLEAATLHDQRFLRSSDPVQLVSEDMNTTGTGLVYDLKLSRGFLHGPTKTDIIIERQTAMNLPKPSIFALGGATMMAASALSAAEIQPFNDAQLKGLDRLAESRSDDFLITTEKAEEAVADSEKASAKADKTMEDFLEEAAVDVPKGKPVDLTSQVPAPTDEPGYKKPASIRAKDGFYFDSEAGIIVFLKDVTVDHPEFTLTGADEIKVFMDQVEKKPEAETDKTGTAEDAKGDEMFGSSEFGDPARIVATGAVVVERKVLQPGDKKAKASGRQMVMDLKTDDLIIRGGQPWILSDTANGRVVDPNGYIRINMKTGDASFVGDARGFVETDKPQQ